MRRFPVIRVVPVALALLGLPLAGAAGCGSHEDVPPERPATASAETASRGIGSMPRVVILGDSLTAGLGLNPDEAYPAVIQRQLADRGLHYEVVNAGVSGDTSAGGLSRLDAALDGDVKVLVLALGANDGLRGLPIDQLSSNLSRIIEQVQARRITVVLAGMEAPPNFGDRYTAAFHAVYPTLARKYHVALVPFLLQNVAAIDSLNQRDGIHPNQRGAEIVADNVWAVLGPMLDGRNTK